MEMLQTWGMVPSEIGALDDTDCDFIEASWQGRMERMIEANEVK